MRRILDLGRLLILPVFTMLLVANILAVHEDMTFSGPFNAIWTAKLVHQVLLVCFYALIIYLYFIRSAASSTTRSYTAKIVAVAATFLPFLIPLTSQPLDDTEIILFASAVSVSGMAMTLYSLGALGKSFSIIPQARTLVQTGPYKFVRHPLYLGELISILGIVLGRFSISAIAIYFLIMALQIYRASQEERLLAGMFPAYASYALKKARFLPGIY